MLNQINHWMEYAAGAADLVLLLRILGLRLQKTYLFITLACAVAVLFDVANFVYSDSERVAFYTEIFAACLFPLAVWDIFEEVIPAVAALRKLAMLRMLASSVLMVFVSLLWLSGLSDNDDPTGVIYLSMLSLMVSIASAAGCLGFLWIMRRGMQLQAIVTPNNTFVWTRFYALAMIGLLVNWVVLVIEPFMKGPLKDSFKPLALLVLNLYSMAITLWCALKLKGLSKNLPAPVSETQ